MANDFDRELESDRFSQVKSGASGLDATPSGGTLESGLVSERAVQHSSLTRGSARKMNMGSHPQNTSTRLNLPNVDIEREHSHVARPVITFRHVTKTYPAQVNKPALKNIDLQIYAGEFVFLVGHSGSGKSTFIRLIIREIKTTKGQILIADEDLSTMKN